MKWVVVLATILLMPSCTNSFFTLPTDALNHWLGVLNPYSPGSTDTANLEKTSTTASLISKTKISTSSLAVQPFPMSQPNTALTTESPRFFRFFQYYTPDVYAGTKSILTEYVNSLTGAYTLIVKDYVADYYTNAIKSYTRATLKMFGWASFGVFLILKGLILDSIYDKVYCNGYYVSEDCYADYDSDDYNATSSYNSSSYTTSSYTTTTTPSSSAQLQQESTTERQQQQQGQFVSSESPAPSVLSAAKTPSTDGDVLNLIKQFLKESGRIETLETLDKESSRLAATRPTEPTTRRTTRRPNVRPAERPTRRPGARPTRRTTSRPTRRTTRRTTRQTTSRPAMEFEYYEEDSEYPEYAYDYSYDYDSNGEAEKLEKTTTTRPPVLLQPKRPTRGRFQDPFQQQIQQQFLQSPIQQQLLQQNLHLQQLQENLRLQKELAILKTQAVNPVGQRNPNIQPIRIVGPATTTRRPTATNTPPLDKIIQEQLQEQKKKLEFLEEHLQSITQKPDIAKPGKRPGPALQLKPIHINLPTTTTPKASLLITPPAKASFESTKRLNQQHKHQQEKLKNANRFHEQQKQKQRVNIIHKAKSPRKTEKPIQINTKPSVKVTDHPLELGKNRATTTPYTSVLLQPGGARNKGKQRVTPENKVTKSGKAEGIEKMQKEKDHQEILPSIPLREKDILVGPGISLPNEGLNQNVFSRTTKSPGNSNSTTSSYRYFPGRRNFERGKGIDGWVEEEHTEPIHQLKVGDWVAVWDTEFSTWYFHNLATKASTWDKPKELEHLNFRDMGERREGKPFPGCSQMMFSVGKIDQLKSIQVAAL